MRKGARWRIAANLATLANGASGAGAIAYALLGNKVFALFLILTGVGWDGLDGFFSRRAADGGSAFGRVADSCADAVTFCAAPAVIVAYNVRLGGPWTGTPWELVGWVAGAAVVSVGVARLVYFTLVAYRRHNFSGASTPQNSMWVALLVLLFQVPGFLGEVPAALFGLTLAFVPLMVLPLRYPKLRRGSPLRAVSAGLAAALALSLIAANFLGHTGGALRAALYDTSFAAAGAAFLLLLVFYLAGPVVTPEEVESSLHDAATVP